MIAGSVYSCPVLSNKIGEKDVCVAPLANRVFVSQIVLEGMGRLHKPPNFIDYFKSNRSLACVQTPQSPSGFSSFLLCAPNQNHHATQAINILNYFTVPPKQWEDVFLLLSYTGMQSIFFFQKTDHALIAL